MKTPRQLIAEMMDRVDRGLIVDIAVVTTASDGAVGSAYSVGKNGNAHTLMGGIEGLKHRLLSDLEYPLECPK